VLILLIGCASTKPFVVSGTALDAVGKTFVQTAGVYEHLLDGQLITVDQYRKWVSFGKKFQATYPSAVEAWKAARVANDKAKADQLYSAIAGLIAELGEYGAEAYKALQGVK
jgi:hypothetical protein